jgi:hypothetical protein
VAVTTKFFDERTDESEAKARIIEKYFATWANVIIAASRGRQDRIAYVDLYAGPGRYKDGSKSTPLLVLERAIAHRDMPRMLVTLFNDADDKHASTLEEEIKKLPGIDTMKYQPQVRCGKARPSHLLPHRGTHLIVANIQYVCGYLRNSFSTVSCVATSRGQCLRDRHACASPY